MKLTLSPRKDAFSLCGVLVGIGIILAGVVVVVVLIRLINIPPRQLPPSVRDEVMENYPDYTNYTSAPWPVYWAPVAMYDYPNPMPDFGEKIYIANIFTVDISHDQMRSWEPVLVWGWSAGTPGVAKSFNPDVPYIEDQDAIVLDGFMYQMKDDWSGIEVTPRLGSTNKCLFWRTTAYD